MAPVRSKIRYWANGRVAGTGLGLACLLAFFGVGNIYATAQSADKVLVQVVNDFNEVSRQVDAIEVKTTHRTAPFGSEITESGTDAENFCIHNTYDGSCGAEYGSSREALTNWTLKNESIEGLGPQIGIETFGFSRDTTFQHHRRADIWKGWNDYQRGTNFNLIPVSQLDVRKARTCDLKKSVVVVGLIRRDGRQNWNSRVDLKGIPAEYHDAQVTCPPSLVQG